MLFYKRWKLDVYYFQQSISPCYRLFRHRSVIRQAILITIFSIVRLLLIRPYLQGKSRAHDCLLACVRMSFRFLTRTNFRLPAVLLVMPWPRKFFSGVPMSVDEIRTIRRNAQATARNAFPARLLEKAVFFFNMVRQLCGNRFQELMPGGRFESLSWIASAAAFLYLVSGRTNVFDVLWGNFTDFSHRISRARLFPYWSVFALA